MRKLALAIITILFTATTLSGFLGLDSDINETDELILEIKGLKYIEEEELAKAVGAKSTGILWSKEFKIKKELVKDINSSAKNFLKDRGFLNAKVSVIEDIDMVEVRVKEGRPIRVKSIKVDSDIDINDLIELKKGDIFSADKFIESKNSIINRLLEEGYCKYELKTKAYISKRRYEADLIYKVRKNRVCRFGKINLEKYPKNIKKRVILSRIKFREGDRFNINKIRDSYIALNKLNTFANIKIAYDLDNVKNYRVDTSISLDTRGKLKRYILSLGIDSEIGVRTRGEWERKNFKGNAQRIKVRTQLSNEYQGLDTQFFAPAMFSINREYLDFYVEGGISNRKTDALKEKKVFLNSYLQLEEEKTFVKLGLGVERLNIDLYESIPSIIGGDFNLIYPYLELIYDARDDKLDPKNGYYLRGYIEYGMSNDKGGVGYMKYLLEGRYIKSYGDLTLAAVAKAGSIHETDNRLPASKLFTGGGVFSNRAYGKNKIGVVLSDVDFLSIGGKSYLNLQLEADYKIYDKLYGAIFFDSTMISAKEYDFKGKRIDTIGVGARYKTPIGPVKVDVGFNAHNKKDYAISIMLGQSF